MDVLQQIEALTSGMLDSFTHSMLFGAALQTLRFGKPHVIIWLCCMLMLVVSSPYRTTSKLANVPLKDNNSPSSAPPPSLPLYTLLPTPSKPALYGRPTMQPTDFEQLAQLEVVRFTTADLLLAYLRLCLAALKLHKGVGPKV